MAIRGTLSAKRRDEDSIGFVLWGGSHSAFHADRLAAPNSRARTSGNGN